MVGPAISAAARVVAKRVASKKTAGQAANGVKNAERITRIYRAANDNKKSQPSSTDNDFTPNNDQYGNGDFKINKVGRTKRANDYVNSSNDQKRVVYLTNTPGRSTQKMGKMKGVIKNKLRKSTWFTVWPIVSVVSPIQFLFGIVTWIAYGSWVSLNSWTWGLSDYIINNDLLFGTVWMIAFIIGIISLSLVALLFISIGKMSVFNRPITFWSFVLLFALAAFPFTAFLPSAGIFSIIVFLVFRKG